MAKLLRRDQRTIKCFVVNSQQGRKQCMANKRHKLTAKDLRRIKREATRNPPAVSRSTRCQVLRDMAEVKKAETRPPLNKIYKLKHQDWATKYLKTDLLKVFWTDEMRVTLDGPDGWARGWITNGYRAPLRVRHQ